jgi:vacuolar protein 8
VAAGGVEPLIGMIRDGNKVAKERAAGVLWGVASAAENQLSVANAGAIAPLVALTRNGTDTAKEHAAGVLWCLASVSENQVAIAQADGIEPLVVLARDGSKAAKERAAGALWGLAHSSKNQLAIAQSGGVAPLVALARDGGEVANENAAGALRMLASLPENQDLIGSMSGIEPLVELARNGSEPVKEKATGALWGLANATENQVKIARQGGVEVLIALLRDGSETVKEYASGALWCLADESHPDIQQLVIAGVETLVAVTWNGTTELVREHAAGTLGNLACGSMENQVTIARVGGINPLVRMSLKGTEEAKIVATVALQHLSANNPDNSVSIALEKLRLTSERVLGRSEDRRSRDSSFEPRRRSSPTADPHSRRSRNAKSNPEILSYANSISDGERITQLCAFSPAIALREVGVSNGVVCKAYSFVLQNPRVFALDFCHPDSSESIPPFDS